MLLAISVVTFIAANPAITAAFIGLLLTLLGVLVGGYFAFISTRLRQLEETDDRVVARVSSIEAAFGRFEEHAESSDHTLQALVSRVEKHMTEEEDKVWTGILKLHDRLTEMHTDNVESHRHLGERLAKVETRMPNGELTKLTTMVESLLNRVK